jgi:raffinose/stachyose/melibiose transport system permease protein
MVICWQLIPFYTILFLAALNGISKELRDTARIDGATDRDYYLKMPFRWRAEPSAPALFSR